MGVTPHHMTGICIFFVVGFCVPPISYFVLFNSANVFENPDPNTTYLNLTLLLSHFILRPGDAFPLMIILKPFKRRMRYMALTKRPYMILE